MPPTAPPSWQCFGNSDGPPSIRLGHCAGKGASFDWGCQWDVGGTLPCLNQRPDRPKWSGLLFQVGSLALRGETDGLRGAAHFYILRLESTRISGSVGRPYPRVN
jgi:hypothetical protein